MQANVKGCLLPAVEDVENGTETGYADLGAVLDAYGIPTRPGPDGRPQVALRAFAQALGQPITYVAAEETVYIAAKPLPPLPAEPVGADVDPWRPVTAPICGGPGDRRADLLTRIIQQFRVATNPRYRPTPVATFCNIYVWDVTRALGCEIPHWVRGDGDPSSPGTGRELDANAVNAWLRHRGPDFGWHPCLGSLYEANEGRPVVATWLNPNGIGHVAMVRPGDADFDRGLPIAQAGARNFDDGYQWDSFIRETAVEFYVHD